VVAIHTDSEHIGYGESCPIGAVYLPAFSGGLVAALEQMAPTLLGQDPTQTDRIYKIMNEVLFGHGYAKAAIDIACWDLLGKQTGLSISVLLGGRMMDTVPAYASIPLADVDAMLATLSTKQAEGFSRFQIKIGGDPIEDADRVKSLVAAGNPEDIFMADANRGWTKADGIRAVNAL
jgi:L-alanine-DL-glutamate epimerase-like enolase superfamily enzyme